MQVSSVAAATFAGLVVAASVAVACQTPMLDALQANRVAAGSWGATGIQLTVAEREATVEYDCGHGSIDQPLTVDRSGRFSAVGTHVVEHGGPQADKEDRRPARYQGQVNGDTMQITITLTDSQQDLGTFTLKRGVTGRLHKCL